MKCPYCNGEMFQGVIHGDRYSLKWIPKEKDKGAIFQWFSKGIKLSDGFSGQGIKSFYCNECSKIVIDVEKEVYNC